VTIDDTEFDVKFYVDTCGNDCYKVQHVSGLIATVSSAHLVEEKKVQLLKLLQQNDTRQTD